MLRVAVAGAAHPHVQFALDEIAANPELELVGVADREPDIARRYADPFQAPVFVDHRELIELSKPDVVVAAGVYGDRARAIVDALDAGCHVIADKPMCTSLDQLDRIVDAHAASDRHLILLLEKRYYPETIAAAQVVRSGELGRIIGITSSGPHKLNANDRPAWFFDEDTYGGLLNDLSVHDIDLARQFASLGPGTVSGSISGISPTHPSFGLYGSTTLHTRDTIVTIEAHWCTPARSDVHGDYQMRLVGTEGVAEIYWARHRVVVTTNSRERRELALPSPARVAESSFRALLDGTEPDISARDGIAATRIALLAQQSAEDLGAPLPFP